MLVGAHMYDFHVCACRDGGIQICDAPDWICGCNTATDELHIHDLFIRQHKLLSWLQPCRL